MMLMTSNVKEYKLRTTKYELEALRTFLLSHTHLIGPGLRCLVSVPEWEQLERRQLMLNLVRVGRLESYLAGWRACEQHGAGAKKGRVTA